RVASQPARKVTIVWIINVVLFDAVSLVESELTDYLGLPVARREHLEDDLGSNAPFHPLFVGAAVALGPAEGHHGVRSRADLRFAFLGIPQQVTRDEDKGVVPEECFQSLLDSHDPLELERVVRHGLAVAVGVFDFGSWRWSDRRAHDRLNSRGLFPDQFPQHFLTSLSLWPDLLSGRAACLRTQRPRPLAHLNFSGSVVRWYSRISWRLNKGSDTR